MRKYLILLGLFSIVIFLGCSSQSQEENTTKNNGNKKAYINLKVKFPSKINRLIHRRYSKDKYIHK